MLALLGLISLTVAALIGTSHTSAAGDQEERARRSEQATPTPTPAQANPSRYNSEPASNRGPEEYTAPDSDSHSRTTGTPTADTRNL